MPKKCPSCNSCLDQFWILPRMFYHCWLEDLYFKIDGGKIVIINLKKETGVEDSEMTKVLETRAHVKK